MKPVIDEDGANALAVAGIPFVHVGGGDLALPVSITRSWPGSRVTDAPIRVHHSVGDTSPGRMQPLLDAPVALGDYYLDERRDVAIRSRELDLPGYRPQLLSTRRRGFEYAISYAHPSDSLRLQWGWHRTILMLALPLRARGLMVHATGFLLPGDAAVLCPGVSGAGKSTLAQVLTDDSVDGVRVLGDDRIAVTCEQVELRAWGTPWHSSAGSSLSADGPLAALVFVRHGGGARLAPLPPSEAVRRLLRAVGIPFWDRSASEFALGVVDRMVSDVPAFEFTYEPTAGAGDALVAGLRLALAAGR